VTENLLVFLIPVVDEVPFERRIGRERRRPWERFRIVPHRVFGAPVADLDRPEARMPPALIRARVVAWHQQVPANVAQRQVIDRDRRLDLDHRSRAVGDHDLVELNPDAPGGRFEDDGWHGRDSCCVRGKNRL
jgi:hypothetical protein